MIRILWSFIRKDALTFVSYRFHMMMVLWGMALMIGHFYFLGRVVGSGSENILASWGGDYFPFAVLGIAFAQYFDFALNGLSGQLRQGQTLGTLEALLVTRTSPMMILLGLVAFQFLFTTAMAMTYIGAGVLTAGLTISVSAVALTLLLLLFTLAAFVGFGMLSASFILVFKKGEPIAMVFQGLSYLLSGVYYPVSILPQWMQGLAQLLPLTHATRAVRIIWLQDGGLMDLLPSLAWLAAFALVFIPLGMTTFRKALGVARRQGSLAQF